MEYGKHTAVSCTPHDAGCHTLVLQWSVERPVCWNTSVWK